MAVLSETLCTCQPRTQCLSDAALSAASLLCLSLPRLPGSNLLFGLPVVMDTTDESVKEGSRVLLTYKGQNLAVLDVESKWTPNKVCLLCGGPELCVCYFSCDSVGRG